MRFFFVLVFSALSSFLLAQEVNVKVILKEKTVNINEDVIVEVILENSKTDQVTIQPENLENLGRVSYEKQISIEKGEVIERKILSYKLRPERAGVANFVVEVGEVKKGPFEVVVQENARESSKADSNEKKAEETSGKAVSTKETKNIQEKIQGTSGSEINEPKKNPTTKKPAKNVNFFVKNITSKKEYLVNEIGVLETYLYFTKIPYQLRQKKQQISNGLNLTPLNVERKPFEEEVINGIRYKKRVIDNYSFYPYQEGNLEIKGGSFEIVYVEDFSSNLKRETLLVPSIQIKASYVKATENEAGSGVKKYNWGDFKIDYSLPEKSTEVGNPLRLIIKVAGVGNFSTIAPSDLVPENETVNYQLANVRNNYSFEENNYRGNKIFEYFLFSNDLGSFELPNLNIVAYSPQQKKLISIEKKLPSINFTLNGGDNNETADISKVNVNTSANVNEANEQEKISLQVDKTDEPSKAKNIYSYILSNNSLFSNLFVLIFIILILAISLVFILFKIKKTKSKNKKTKLSFLLNEFEHSVKKVTEGRGSTQKKYKEVILLLKELTDRFSPDLENSEKDAGTKKQKLPFKESHIKIFCLKKIEYFERKIQSQNSKNNFTEDIEKTMSEWKSIVS